MKFVKDESGELLFLNNYKTFGDIKKEYVDFRKQEWFELRKFINSYFKNKVEIIAGGNAGHGVENYTGGGTFEKYYDMTNWLWIELKINENKFLISFQPPVKNKNTKNEVVLPDRIGIYKYDESEANFQTILENIDITDIALPLNDITRKEICDIIENMQTNK